MPPKYKTKLTPEEEQQFRQWYGNYATVTGNNSDPDAEGYNYDYRGYWKANPNAEVSNGMHLPDTWKTPGHETFSDESMYYNEAPDAAGFWDVDGNFVKPLASNAAYSDKIAWTNGRYAAKLKRLSGASADRITEINNAHKATLQAIYDQQKAIDDAAIDKISQAQAEVEKNGADRILEMGERIKTQQQEGDDQIAADQKAARWTGAGELAAAVANMIAVGSGNAVSQTYKSYSQDWMQKAERDMKEHRSRMDNLNERLRTLKERQDALRLGNIQTLEGMRQAAAARQAGAAVQMANADNAARLKAEELRIGGEQAAAEAQAKGVAMAAGQKNTEATLGQNQQRIDLAKQQAVNSMIAAGWVPDKTKEGGYRYDPKEAEKKYGVKVTTKPTTGRGDLELPIIDANGNVNLARIGSKEQLQLLMDTAINAIRRDLGDEKANELQSRLTMAADNKENVTAILTEWIGKSKTMEKELRHFDPDYKGVHTSGANGFTGGEMSGDAFLKALNG